MIRQGAEGRRLRSRKALEVMLLASFVPEMVQEGIHPMSEQRELQKIECLVSGLHSWRGLQRIVSVYQAWCGHLRVRVLVPTQRPWTGTALGVLRYEALPEGAAPRPGEERVLEILVQREDDQSTAGVLIEHLQAVEVVW